MPLLAVTLDIIYAGYDDITLFSYDTPYADIDAYAALLI